MKEQQSPRISQEILNSLMDDEFPPLEKAELLSRVQADKELSEEACSILALKDMVRLAYREVPLPIPTPRKEQQRRWPRLAAGVLLVIGGGFAGWALHPDATPTPLVLLEPDDRATRTSTGNAAEMRIVFHVSRPDTATADELLSEVELLLNHYQQERQALRVEVVAHGSGLGLLRARLSRHKQRIAALSERFRNLTFVACQNSIDRLRVEDGIEVVLLPQARRTESGVAHVVRRQQQGWAYIQV